MIVRGYLQRPAGLIVALAVGSSLVGCADVDTPRLDPRQQAFADMMGVPVEITNSLGMRLRLIPSGIYQRGSPPDEWGRSHDELRHRARIPYPFYMAVMETTQREYEEIMGANPSQFDLAPDFPVDRVLWEEALEFCNALSRREGFPPVYERRGDGWVGFPERDGYRLPYEAEWEFACRAGSTNAFHNGPIEPLEEGSATLQRVAWFKENSRGQPQPVGQLEPNAWGLYDILGNLHEWCWDWYAPYPRDHESDFTGPAAGEARVVRGGGWYSTMEQTRCAARRPWYPFNHWNSLGFRIVRTVRPEAATAP